MNRMQTFVLFLLTLTLLFTSACSWLPKSTEGDYEKSRSHPALEEPPEISLPTPGSAYKIPKSSAPKVAADGESSKASSELELKRDGLVRWLNVPLSAEKLWPQIIAFWQSKEVKLAESDEKLAMLETEWVESKAGIPTEGLKGLLKKAVGTDSDLALRDKYRVRVQGDNGSSQVFLTHRGAVLTHGKSDAPHWEMRQPEPEREAEMLRKLQLFLSHQ